MCRIAGVTTGIKNLDFAKNRGKMAVSLSDGREVIVPLSMFPDIKKMSLKDRDGWMILDDQFFTFEKLTKVFSLSDILKL